MTNFIVYIQNKWTRESVHSSCTVRGTAAWLAGLVHRWGLSDDLTKIIPHGNPLSLSLTAVDRLDHNVQDAEISLFYVNFTLATILTAWIFMGRPKHSPMVRIPVCIKLKSFRMAQIRYLIEKYQVTLSLYVQQIDTCCTWRKLSICWCRDVMSGWRELSVNSWAFSWSRLAALPPTLSSHSSLPNRFLNACTFNLTIILDFHESNIKS
jgi:hypothetical protein